MQKVMKSTKKDISLILCIIYFSYLIFKIFIQKEIIMTNNSILKTIYFFKIDKLLFCIPILYYFIKNNKVICRCYATRDILNYKYYLKNLFDTIVILKDLEY